MAQTLSDLTQTEPLPGHGRWEAELCLGFAAGAGKTVLKHRSHKRPPVCTKGAVSGGGYLSQLPVTSAWRCSGR